MKNNKAKLARLMAAMQSSAAAQGQAPQGVAPNMGQPSAPMGMNEPGQYSGDSPEQAVATTHRFDER